MKLPKNPKTREADNTPLAERITRATNRFLEVKARKEETYRSKPAAKATIRVMWEKEQSGSNPSPLDDLGAMIVKQAWVRHIARGNKPNFLDLLKWAMRDWDFVMKTQFKFMPNPPAKPTAKFFVGCVGQFISAYQHREELERRSHLTTREQLIEELIDKGKSLEAAEREVDEKLGLLKIKREIQEERAKLKLVSKNVEEAEARENRLKLMERSLRRKERRGVDKLKAEAAGTFDTWK